MIKKVTEIENILIYDVEVFKYGWSVAFYDYHKDEMTYFESGENSQGNTGYDVKQYIDSFYNPLTVGFNNKGYDNHILRLIMADYTHSQIKELNDFIIQTNEAPWHWSGYPRGFFPYAFTDLMDDMAERISLKMIEGNLGQEIKESGISFDLDRPLTKEEWKINKEYNIYDVEVTRVLFDKRLDYLNTKIELGRLGMVEVMRALQMTNAQLVATYLVGPYAKPFDYGDDDLYEIPTNIHVKDREITNYFIDPDKPSRLEVTVGGIPHVLSGGGLHGDQSNYHAKSCDEWKIVLADGTQFYPTIMVNYNMLSRSVVDPTLFRRSVEDRLKYRAIGDKRQETFKLVNNTTYGASGAKFNALYDKRMANSICYTGQLLLIDLIEKLEVLGDKIEFIQSNTDGIMYKYHVSVEEEMLAIAKEWEKRTKIDLDFEYIDVIFQRDVNNYIMRETNGKITVKGGHLKGYHGRTHIDGELHIVAKAIGDYLLYQTPIEETINSSTDILDFQMLARTGRTYEGTIWETPDGDVEVNRVNRVYATKDKRYGSIYKIRSEAHESGPKRDKIANVPLNAIVDNENQLTLDNIDKMWYNDFATKRVYGFLGEGGKHKMAKGLSRQAERRTYLRLNADSNKVKMFNKGDVISGDWTNEDVLQITKRQFDELNEIEEVTPKEKIMEDKKVVEVEEVEEIEEVEETESLDEFLTKVRDEDKRDRLAYYKKRAKARRLLSESEIFKDGYNAHSKYDYISADAIRIVFNNALMGAGLEYEMDIVPESFKVEKQFTASMHLNSLEAIIRFIDLETGYVSEHRTMNVAADTSDKGLNKVTTAIIKYYVINNFLISGDSLDADEVTSGVQNQTTSGYVSPESRTQAKATVTQATQPSQGEVDILTTICADIKGKSDSEDTTKFLDEVRSTLTKKPLLRDEILKLTIRAENLLTELKEA